MESRKECKRDLEEESSTQNKVLFTAVTIVFVVACLKRALIVMLLVQQWRAWVFLLLNLILLAIFFTSDRTETKPIHGIQEKKVNKYNNDDDDDNNNNTERKKKKKKQQFYDPQFEATTQNGGDTGKGVDVVVVERSDAEGVSGDGEVERSGVSVVDRVERRDVEYERVVVEVERKGGFGVERKGGEVDVGDGDGDEEVEEKLNERVEAFITMFKEHLVVDARRGRDKILLSKPNKGGGGGGGRGGGGVMNLNRGRPVVQVL